MGLRENIRTFFYAVTHANEMVKKEKELTAKVADLEYKNKLASEHQKRTADEVKDIKQAFQKSMQMVLSDEPTLEELEALYEAVKPNFERSISIHSYKRMELSSKFSFLNKSERGQAELKRIGYMNTLVKLGVLPKNCEVRTLGENAKQIVREDLGALVLPKDMPVGQIDYLAPNGMVGDSMVFYDAAAFVEHVMNDNFYGEPMDITVFADPKTNNHIDTSWRLSLNPPPQGFQVKPYVPSNEIDYSQEHEASVAQKESKAIDYLISSAQDKKITSVSEPVKDQKEPER